MKEEVLPWAAQVYIALFHAAQELHALCPPGRTLEECQADDCVVRSELLHGRIPE